MSAAKSRRALYEQVHKRCAEILGQLEADLAETSPLTTAMSEINYALDDAYSVALQGEFDEAASASQQIWEARSSLWDAVRTLERLKRRKHTP